MLLQFTRIWLPVIVVTAGVLVMVLGGDDNALEGGGAIVGAGLSIWLLNALHRVGVDSEHVREEEDEARTYFDTWGHWPDEPGPGNGQAPQRTPPRR